MASQVTRAAFCPWPLLSFCPLEEHSWSFLTKWVCLAPSVCCELQISPCGINKLYLLHFSCFVLQSRLFTMLTWWETCSLEKEKMIFYAFPFAIFYRPLQLQCDRKMRVQFGVRKNRFVPLTCTNKVLTNCLRCLLVEELAVKTEQAVSHICVVLPFVFVFPFFNTLLQMRFLATSIAGIS